MIDVIEVIYEDLVVLRNTKSLTPGKYYRIIDYFTTTTQTDTVVDNHRFDIIVKAVDEAGLSEEARVCKHDGEEYFNDSKLESWKAWYSLDNDKSLFKWADENGKGVIYRLIDEFNNDCPYDFKNIKFYRSKDWIKDHKVWCESVLGFVPEEGIYLYTFSWLNKNHDVLDASIIGISMANDFGGVSGVHDNKISPCDSPATRHMYKLNNNVFVSTQYWSDNEFYGIYGNLLKTNCQENTFGNECQNNILYNNCISNTFGNHCQSNKLMMNCNGNRFKSSSYCNTLGTGCEFILLNNSTYNTFGPECSNITSCAAMHCNTFGSYCQNINCGNSKYGDTRTVKFNIFENNVRFVDIMASKSFSTGALQNITICQGVKGYRDENLQIQIPVVNQDYQIKVAKNSKGDLKIYCEADLIP